MKTTKSCSLWIVTLLLVSLSGIAFSAEKPSDLRRQMEKAEQELYALYNKVNTDPQYAMICKVERAGGSPFATRVCQPRFFEEAQRAYASERIQSATHADSSTPGSAPSFWQDEGFRKHMLEVMQKNPKLQALGEKRDALQARLNELTKK